jgi:outer membrane protein
MGIKMRLFFLLIIQLCFSAQAVTLKDAWHGAQKNMESLKRAEQGIDQREEQKTRAKAALLPTVNGFANYTRIDPPATAGFSAFTLTKQYSVGVRLTQPLIRGGAYSALKMANENILLAKFQKDSTALNLYQMVIDSFYNLKIAQTDVKNLSSLLTFSKERLSEIRSRAQIGRSRKGELVEAEAQLHTAESQYQQGVMELRQIEKNFEFLTQIGPEDIPELGDIPKLDKKLESFLHQLKQRPDILAARQQIKVADYQVNVSKGGHYPSLDLVGNYYIDRTGILATSEWDAGIVLSIPFFQGGGVQSSIREAVASKAIAELTAHESVRVAEREMSILYQNYLQLQEQLKTLEQALKKSEEAYKLNKKDYQFGLVTNLDVLQSLNSFIQTKRSYDSLLTMAHMNFKSLEAAAGELP